MAPSPAATGLGDEDGNHPPPDPSDVNDDEWTFVVPHLTVVKHEAPRRDRDSGRQRCPRETPPASARFAHHW